MNSLVSPTISGTVKGNISGLINSGWAYLVQYDSILKRQHVVDSVTINNGKYLFNTSIGGKFLVYAEANASVYPLAAKTYSLHAVQWDSAAIIKAPCSAIDTANINVYEFSQATGTGGSLSGTIVKGVGYVGHRAIPNNPALLGEPIPGLDVNLEQHPAGIIAHTVTDALGNYVFNSLPAGSSYSIFVDIPGLGMTSQYTRFIASTQTFAHLDYIVDSAYIRPDSTLAASIIQNSFADQIVHVAPNPFKDQLAVNYALTEPADVSLEIFNIIGERISFVSKSRQDTGIHNYMLNASENNMKEGTYVLRITVGGKVYTQRIVCMP